MRTAEPTDSRLDGRVRIKEDRHHSMSITHASRNGKTYSIYELF